MEKEKKPVVMAEPVMSKSVDFQMPDEDCRAPANIATKVKADEDCFVPQMIKPNVASIFINLNEKELDYTGEKFTRVPTRGVLQFDCGFSLSLGARFQARFSINEKYSKKGLMLMLPSQQSEGRVILTVLNMGKEFLKINNKEAIAEMWVEPTYNIDLRLV